MSLFLPSNLSPNFEEVVNNIYNDNDVAVGVNIDFEFQVNTNGSCVRSYKLEILNDKNDADVEDDNILATFYGIFDTPLYNKDIHTLTLTYDQIQSQMNLVIPKDYRWRIRLYEDNILQQKEISLSNKSEITAADISDIYYDEHWNSELALKFNYNNVPDKLIYKLDTSNKSTWLEYEDIHSMNNNTVVIQLPDNNTWGSIELLSYSHTDDDGNMVYQRYEGGYKAIYYHNRIDVQTVYGNTYVGAGHTVGTTKNVIWTSKLNNDIIEDKYIQTVLYSHDTTNDFNPFNEKIVNINRQEDNQLYQKGNILEYRYNDDQTKILGIKINLNEILPEYREKISNGNMYVCVDYQYGSDVVLNYDTNQLPKRVEGFSNEDYEGYEPTCILMIDENQPYDTSKNEINFKNTYSLVYIQRQQIYSVDKSVGMHQLNKITLDKPLDYNTFHGTNIETGLVSDDFDYGRVYINPVKEFDDKTKLISSAYINIAYTADQLIITGDRSESYNLLMEQPDDWNVDYMRYYEVDGNGGYKKITADSAPTFSQYTYYTYGIPASFLSKYQNSLACTTITNYVSKTGECSLYSNLKFKPDRFYMYQIFILDENAPNYDPSKSNNPYKFYTGVKLSDLGHDIEEYYYLGGQHIACVWESKEFIIDVNNDGNINDDDAAYLLYNTSNTFKYPLSFNARLCDYNGDGIISDEDVIILQTFHNKYNVDASGNPVEVFKNFLSDTWDYDVQSKIPVFNYNNRNNILPIYSNHQIGNTNQYMCFIQPNVGISEDQYKPCMLQLYNNKTQHDLYITNYNGNNMYNKDYSIDKLDDSQWLVALTLPDGLKQYDYTMELHDLIQKPQTKYKIYTNFVNSIPEAYFYYRSDKILEFQYFDFYNGNELVQYDIGDDIILVPTRDITVKCNIYDANDSNKIKNEVPIKYYKYAVAEVDKIDRNIVKSVIYESDNLYDGKNQYVIKGLSNYYKQGVMVLGTSDPVNIVENPSLYRIQITAEDEYGMIHAISQDVYFGYYEEIVNDRIAAESDVSTQSIHVDFAPVKSFNGHGEIESGSGNSYVVVNDANGLIYDSLQDSANNVIDIPDQFVFYAKLKIGNGFFDTSEEQDVFSIETTSEKIYSVKFDTRVYVRDTNQYTKNGNYLSLKLYENGNELSVIKISSIYTNLVEMSQFEYAVSSSTENITGVYFIEDGDSDQVAQLNYNDDVKLKNSTDYLIPGVSETSYSIYDNDDLDVNSSNKNKMAFLYFKLSTLGNNPVFAVSDRPIS